jgi:GT2 family glycosyltransferase
MDVSIIIINYNTYDITIQCLESIFNHTIDIEFEVILVDNASVECDSTIFSTKFPSIKLIKSNENLGFSKGNNLGIKNASGKYILLLNSDTILIENSIKKLFNRISQDDEIGVITSKLIYPDKRNQYNQDSFPNIVKLIFEMFRLQKIFKKFGGRYLLNSFYKEEKEIFVDWVWGTVFMFPKSSLNIFPENKLFETYFMYWEDMEWCYQYNKYKYKVLYYPNTTVIHIGGSSNSSKKNIFLNENKKKLIISKHSKLFYYTYTIMFKLLKFTNINSKY